MAHKFGHYVFVSMLDMLPPQWRDPMQWVFVCAASFVRAISCFMRYAGVVCVAVGMGARAQRVSRL